MPCDYKKYPHNWKAIRAFILEREGHCCKKCGAPNGEIVARKDDHWKRVAHSQEGDELAEQWKKDGYRIVKIVLTVAHLNHDITDNRPENLAALCQLHHLRHDHKHHMENAAETRRKKKGLQNLFP